MQYEIKHIHENLGVSMVYVTHDQSEALTMSNRIAVFDDGIIQQLAPPDDLYEQSGTTPSSPQFIGENNKIAGKIKGFNGSTCRVAVEGGEIEALAVNVREGDADTLLSLRPERVTINPANGQFANVFDARVEEQIYLGDHMRTRVNVCGHDDFIVKVPNAAGHVHITPGDQVEIGWHAEDCRALDALPN